MSRSMPLLTEEIFPQSDCESAAELTAAPTLLSKKGKRVAHSSTPVTSIADEPDTDSTPPPSGRKRVSHYTSREQSSKHRKEAKHTTLSDEEVTVPQQHSPTTTVVAKVKSQKQPKIKQITPSPRLTATELFGEDSGEEDVEAQADNTESMSYDNVLKCEKCDVVLMRKEYQYHLRTNLHKFNCLLATEFKNINVITTAFKNRVMTYCVKAVKPYLTPEQFLIEHENDVSRLVELSLEKHKTIKVQFELFAYFMLSKTEEKQLKSFNTKYEIICNISELKKIFGTNGIETMKKKFTEFEHYKSGWSFSSISHLEININKYCPMRGGTYIKLPPRVANTKSCINVKNDDDFCFLWSILAGLYPTDVNSNRCSSYPNYSEVFNLKDMTFPPSFRDITIFERNNENISVNIFGLSRNKKIITGPLYISSGKKINHFNLLYIENKTGKGHYCLIKNLWKLIRCQITKHRGTMFLCELCLQSFKSEYKHKNHNCSKVLQLLPKKDTYLMFKHYERQQKIHFIIYADFESLLENYSDNSINTNTKKIKIHKPSCFAYYVCCSYNESLNKLVSYRGSDATEVFIKTLIHDVTQINEILRSNKSMIPLNEQQQYNYDESIYCHICKHLLFDDKVRDHDHVTGEYRGAAHSYCNLTYKVCPFIPVVFHNLCGYDLHLFIMELVKYDGSINVIPKTKEKYITITKSLKMNTENDCFVNVKFIDSFQFLNASLDKLSLSLNASDFVHTSKFCETMEQFDLLRKKGVYPYDYMNCHSKYNEKCLPPKQSFYNSLKNQHITDFEYNHAQNVWNMFHITNMGEYTDLYLRSDVLLLSDIFENFRTMSMYHYKLDPAYYVTSPGLSWEAMLLYTNVRLELVNDLEIYQMLEKGVRGGLAQCSLRHAKANNMYLKNYDESKPSTYLIYLDCNNLYGFAMMKKMPISGFRFLSQSEISGLNVGLVSDDSEYGLILEVDLEYPDYLHDTHNDLPFAVEKQIPPGSKSSKLIANLYDKHCYVIHYVHLKECLKHGLILKKIHRVITFRQESFLKKYIDLNTSLRQNAKSDFEKDFFKLLNNSIFGKTIENKRKQVNVKLVTNWEDQKNTTNKHIGARKLIAKPNLKSLSVFSENFLAIQLGLDKITLDRPLYVGFTVLEFAKQHMYQFHYDFMKEKYGENCQLCYTDTDSLLYLIYTDDVYEDMKANINELDTSNYTINNQYGMPRVNNKIPGLFKDELGGELITEFVGLRAKLYGIKTVRDEIKKAKGVSKSVVNHLNIENYTDSLLKDKDLKCKMNIIKSIKHSLYSQEINKLVLNRNDDKRIILNDQIHTMAWGHYAFQN